MQTPKPHGFFTTAREAACVFGLIAIAAVSTPAQAENASNCARYGADYVAVSGSSNCVRVGGHVRVNNLPRSSGAPLAYAPDQRDCIKRLLRAHSSIAFPLCVAE